MDHEHYSEAMTRANSSGSQADWPVTLRPNNRNPEFANH